MQSPLILEVPKLDKGRTIGWPVHLCSSRGLGVLEAWEPHAGSSFLDSVQWQEGVMGQASC